MPESNTTSTDQQSATDFSLAAEPVWQNQYFTIVNSLVNSWLAVIIIVILAIVVRSKIKLIPRGLQSIFEVLLEQAMTLADSITGSRVKTQQFLPLVLPLFIFILVNNWLGILPGVGTIGYLAEHQGHPTFIPYLRSGMADMNSTLALAIVTVFMSHLVGLKWNGLWKHINRFVGLNLLREIPSKLRAKEFSVLIVNPIKMFVGFIELVGELTKVASLSLRLFGNIFAGEVLLAVIASLFAFVAPIPFLLLEILVGFVQAFIFSMLALVFCTIMSESHAAEEHT